jgi:hypothetical protein
MPTVQVVGTPGGGSPFSETCPTDQVLIGFNGTSDLPNAGAFPYADTLEGVCGTISISGSSPYAITITRTGMLTRQGDPGPIVQNRICQAGQIIVGFDWRTGMYVDQLTFRCAPLTIANDGASFKLSIGAATALSPIGGSGGTAVGQTNCPDGQIATGNVGRQGQLIDAFGLLCATPSLVFAAL